MRAPSLLSNKGSVRVYMYHQDARVADFFCTCGTALTLAEREGTGSELLPVRLNLVFLGSVFSIFCSKINKVS